MKKLVHLTEDVLLNNGFEKKADMYKKDGFWLQLVKGYSWEMIHKDWRWSKKVRTIQDVNRLMEV